MLFKQSLPHYQCLIRNSFIFYRLSELSLTTQSHTELIPDMLIIVEDAADDLDALLSLFTFFLFQ